MNGRESLWGWLGLGVLIEVVGGALLGIGFSDDDSSPAWVIGGYVIAGLGGMLVAACLIGIGVTVGMLRYDFLRTKR